VFYEQDNLPIFDSDGQLTDSGTSLQTLPTTIQALNEQAQAQANVVPAVGDSLVLRAADGKLKETAIRVDDTAARSTNVLWTSAKVQALAPPTTPLTMALLDATGQVTSTNLKVDDTATEGTNILWSNQYFEHVPHNDVQRSHDRDGSSWRHVIFHREQCDVYGYGRWRILHQGIVK
jgi:hypothetical protein